MLVSAIAFLAGVSPAFAQDALWHQFYDAGSSAMRAGDFAVSEKQLTAALAAVERLDKPDDCAMVLKDLATVLINEGKLGQAGTIYLKLMALHEKANDSSLVCTDLRNLAQLARKQGKLAEADGYLQKAIGLVKAEKKTDALPGLLGDEAIVLQLQGDYPKVESTLIDAIGICESGGKSEDLMGLSLIERLADFYMTQSRFVEAEPLYTRSITSRRKVAKAQDTSLIRDLVSLAVLNQKQGKKLEAELLFKQALAMSESQFGAKDLEVANELISVARFYSDTDRASSAIPLLERALVVRVEALKGTDLRLAETLNLLGSALLDQDNYAAAEKYLNRALAIDNQNEQAGKLRQALDLSSLGKLYLSQGKYQQAEASYKQALEITESEKGPQHPDTASAMNNLALLYRNNNHYDLAEKLLRNALSIREHVFGLDHPTVAQNLLNLADVLTADGKPELAEPLLVRALKIDEDAFGVEHEYVAMVLRDLIEVLRLQKDKGDTAEKYARKLLARDKRTTSDESLIVGRDMEVLSTILVAQNKLEEAKSLKKQAAAILNKASVADGPTSLPAGDSSATVFHAKPVREKWALLVGISSFQDPSLNLKYAAKDATDFSNFLIKEANFKPDHVKLLTDADATRANIISLLGDKWLKRVAQKDDLVVIYISSHGTQAAHQVGDTNFIVPYEANFENIVFSGIPMQWLNAGLADLVHCDRTYVFLDVCHSGAAAGPAPTVGQGATALASGLPPSHDEKEVGQKNLSRPSAPVNVTLSTAAGQVVVAASRADQVSWESKRYPNGVFTRNLIIGLKINADRTTMGQAYNYLKDSVEEEVLRDRNQLQSPVIMPRAGYGIEANLACPSQGR